MPEIWVSFQMKTGRLSKILQLIRRKCRKSLLLSPRRNLHGLQTSLLHFKQLKRNTPQDLHIERASAKDVQLGKRSGRRLNLLNSMLINRLKRFFRKKITISDVLQEHPTVGIKTMQFVAEMLARTQRDAAASFMEEQLPTIEQVWKYGDVESKNAIVSLVNHWSHLGLIKSEQIAHLARAVPRHGRG